MKSTKPTLKDQLRAALGGNTHYQTHTWKGEVLNTGIRGIDRRKYMLAEDFKGKRVLDLGCSTGAECIWAAEQGARIVYGVDVGEMQIRVMRELIKLGRLGQVVGIQWDLREGLPTNVADQEWDTVICCNLVQYLGYDPIWARVKGAKVVYLESGADFKWQPSQFIGWIPELLGMMPNNNADPTLNRQLYRLTLA